MLNSKLINVESAKAIEISEYEELETDENCKVVLKHLPVD